MSDKINMKKNDRTNSSNERAGCDKNTLKCLVCHHFCIVSDVVEKITTRRREGVVVEKKKKVDELSTKIRVIYLQQ